VIITLFLFFLVMPLGQALHAYTQLQTGLGALQRMFDTGRLANTGYLSVAELGSKVASPALYVVMARQVGSAAFGVYVFGLSFVSLVTTPSHPEYPAGHPALNGAAATVLSTHFADVQTFMLTTFGQPSQTYTSISQARADGNDARVWGGMHYPSTVAVSDAAGEAAANYVDATSMQLLRDQQ